MINKKSRYSAMFRNIGIVFCVILRYLYCGIYTAVSADIF